MTNPNLQPLCADCLQPVTKQPDNTWQHTNPTKTFNCLQHPFPPVK